MPNPSLEAYLAELKSEALPGVWSKGVQLARAIKSFQRTSGYSKGSYSKGGYPAEQRFRIQTTERALAYEVTLWLEDQDAHCNCGSKVEPCAHLVGLLLALQNGLDRDLDSDTGPDSSQPHLVYEWSVIGGRLHFLRHLQIGKERKPLDTSLMSHTAGVQSGRIPGPMIPTAPLDLKLDRLLSASTLDWPELLKAISELGELPFQDPVTGASQSLRALSKPVEPELVLRWKSTAKTILVLEPKLGDNQGTRFQDHLWVSQGCVEWRVPLPPSLDHKTEITQERLDDFLLHKLPSLQQRHPITIEADLPRIVDGAPSLHFEYQTLGTEWMTITAKIVYPDAPQVTRDGVQTTLVRRDLAREQELHHELRHHYGMLELQPLKLSPSDALEVRGRFQNAKLDGFLISSIGASVGLSHHEIDLDRLKDFTLVELLLNAKDATEQKLIAQSLRSKISRAPTPIENLKPPALIPRAVWNKLRPYQKEGVIWLHERKSSGTGAILADDMGLGKTIQTLAILEPRTLVVVPTSLLYNWRQELQAHRPELKLCVYHGPSRNWDIYADVILTTYGTVRSETARFYESWNVIVLDEAHLIRNANTLTTEIILDLPARFRVALTGTPVQNRSEDLDTLLRFISPQKSVSRRMLPAYLLRRTKDEVLQDLPAKTRIEHHLELSETEKGLYAQTFAAAKKEILEKLARREGNVLNLFESLLRSRELCDHLCLIDPNRQADRSTKLDRLIELVTELRDSGHSVLVYSQWTRFLDRIEQDFVSRALKFVRLDGSTTRREDVIRSFSESPEPMIFLLSLHAGGVGLNLTKADHVIFCEPWWNPFVEFQAEDRVHRLGQKNAVTIHRLLCVGTIEEKIRELQHQKEELGQAILENRGGEVPAPSLQREDLEQLLS